MSNDKTEFIIQTRLFSEQHHESECLMLVFGKNILEYVYKDEKNSRTTTGNLDDLMAYLEHTLEFTDSDEPFPYCVSGNTAAELDRAAREFSSDDMDVFDEYYDKLDEWSYAHSWLHAGNGYYLPDVMFRRVSNEIEISWDNENLYEDVLYTSLKGYVRIPCEQYKAVIQSALEDYHKLWRIGACKDDCSGD